MSADALFCILARASPATDSKKYLAGRRYELIAFIRERSTDDAKQVFTKMISEAGWEFPEITEIAQVSGNMKMEKAQDLGLDDAMRAAARHGSALVIFEESDVSND